MIRRYGPHDRLAAGHVRPDQYRFPTPLDTYSDGIDWIAVERAARGELHPTALTDAERREAAVWMCRAGIARKAVSVQLCVYERLVKEWQADAGLLGPDDLCTRPGCNRARSGRGLCAVCLCHQRLLDRQQKAARTELEAAA